MRILIVIPQQPQATGNWVTAERFRRGLNLLGHETEILPVHLEEDIELGRMIVLFKPDVALLLHAYRSGVPWFDLTEEPRPPCAVLLTGTDINQDLDHPQKGPQVRRILAQVPVIISQNEAVLAHPHLQGLANTRLRYLPPGIELGTKPCRLRETYGLPTELPLLLHPAGIRPVKGNLELLKLLIPLVKTEQFTAVFCGPLLDEDYAKVFLAEVASHPWARYLGAIDPQAMPTAMMEADLILNNSANEGLPNALLEATAIGRPILARNIPGNAAVVDPGVNGLLYDTAEDFLAKAQSLIRDPELRCSLSNAKPDRFSPSAEARQLEEILLQARDTAYLVYPQQKM